MHTQGLYYKYNNNNILYKYIINDNIKQLHTHSVHTQHLTDRTVHVHECTCMSHVPTHAVRISRIHIMVL